MDSKQGRGQFLGTEDIVRRLRQTQGSVLRGWPLRAAGAAVAILAVAGGLYAVLPDHRQPQAKVTVVDAAGEAIAEGVASLAPSAPGAAGERPPPVHGRGRGAVARGDAANDAATASDGDVVGAGGAYGSPGAAPVPAGWLRVRLLHAPPGTRLSIDGLAAGAVERWQGTLPRGKHTLILHYGRSRQRHVVVVQQGAQEVVVDVPAHRIHARPLPGGRKGR